MSDFKNIPLRAANSKEYTPLQSLAEIRPINTPTEVDHYQIRRVIDVYVMPKSEDLSGISNEVNKLIGEVEAAQERALSACMERWWACTNRFSGSALGCCSR